MYSFSFDGDKKVLIKFISWEETENIYISDNLRMIVSEIQNDMAVVLKEDARFSSSFELQGIFTVFLHSADEDIPHDFCDGAILLEDSQTYNTMAMGDTFLYFSGPKLYDHMEDLIGLNEKPHFAVRIQAEIIWNVGKEFANRLSNDKPYERNLEL